MPHYIGFIRASKDAHDRLGPDEAQRVLENYLAWDDERTKEGRFVGGYQVIEADDFDQAEKIFATHPHLEFGPIEVRQVGERGCED
ncbi:YciI family protein [Amycolatopsis orientalis]|uniref:YciI family protein n=1 Tax=Amycolatopsis orientalis TaxID=31958 RepID=UPI0003F6EEEE|nr:YciI family protein [Amycolatopsis orientalis]